MDSVTVTSVGSPARIVPTCMAGIVPNNPSAFAPSRELLRQLLLRCSNFLHPCRSPALPYLPTSLSVAWRSDAHNSMARIVLTCMDALMPRTHGCGGAAYNPFAFLHLGNCSDNCSSTAVPDAVLPPPSIESCVVLTSSVPAGRPRCSNSCIPAVARRGSTSSI